jgi:hypothetical protein
MRALRHERLPNQFFFACGLAFLAGAIVSAAGFITGALLH